MKIRLIFILAAMVLTGLFIAPAASAVSPYCDYTVTDRTDQGVINHAEVVVAAREFQKGTGADVYIHALQSFSDEQMPYNYANAFMAHCEPTDGYVLIVFDTHGIAEVFYGPRFANLAPALNMVIDSYREELQGTGDRTKVVVDLLGSMQYVMDINAERCRQFPNCTPVTSTPPAPPEPSSESNTPKPADRESTGMWGAIGGLALAALLVGGVAIYVRRNDPNKVSPKAKRFL